MSLEKNEPLPRFLYVEWIDARGAGEHWQMVEGLSAFPLDACKVFSAGFVLREDDQSLHIAPHYVQDGKDSQYCGDMVIPKSAIEKAVQIPFPPPINVLSKQE